MKHLVEIPLEVIESFAPVRKRIQKAVDSLPKNVTLEEAREQVRVRKSVQEKQAN